MRTMIPQMTLSPVGSNGFMTTASADLAAATAARRRRWTRRRDQLARGSNLVDAIALTDHLDMSFVTLVEDVIGMANLLHPLYPPRKEGKCCAEPMIPPMTARPVGDSGNVVVPAWEANVIP